MNRQEINVILEGVRQKLDAVQDEVAVSIIEILLNLVERLAEENEQLKKENQALKDELNRLKGAQARPQIRKSKQKSENSDHSSEKQRKKPKKDRKSKNKKKQTVQADRQVLVEFDASILPDDARFKDYNLRTIQDIRISTDNVEFKRPVYYSPSLKQTFMPSLPEAYQGSEFGPCLRSWILFLHNDAHMTIPAIERFFKTIGIQIVRSTLSRFLTQGHESFHQEKADIFDAGMRSGICQTDDTGCRVDGKAWHTHIFCNALFTAYFTREHKDRLTLLEIICRGKLYYALDQRAFELMQNYGLAEKWLKRIEPMLNVELLEREKLDAILSELLPDPKKQQTLRRIILESCALSYYQGSEYFIEHLMSDDAPQFKQLAKLHALCWIHEGRHFHKLNPLVWKHRKILETFIEAFWEYYHDLLAFKENPSEELAKALTERFDVLFSATTGYEALDERIRLTAKKKKALLLILSYPFLELHNNESELGARIQARIRDIHLHTLCEAGTKAKDSFATIIETTRKLGVNAYEYFFDKISKQYKMPSLAELITLATEQNLPAT